MSIFEYKILYWMSIINSYCVWINNGFIIINWIDNSDLIIMKIVHGKPTSKRKKLNQINIGTW